MSSLEPMEFGGNELGHLPEVAQMFEGVSRWDTAVRDFGMTIDALKADAVKSIGFVNKHPSNQYWRRNAIKNLFAWFEGQIFLMKRVALERYEHYHIEFTTAEIALLSEDKYTLDEKGGAHSAPTNYQKFLANYQFAFRCFSKAHASTFVLDRTKVPDLRRLEGVRNRLTHAKTFSDLSVSDEEIKLAEGVLAWHVNQSVSAFAATVVGNPLEVKKTTARISTQLDAQLPVLMLCSDGAVYEFPTKKAAHAFAKVRGARRSELDYTLYSMRDLLDDL